jgi:co-chaperonin GroES (HSP10)
MNLTARNTLVIVRLDDSKEKIIGGVIVLANSEQFTEATVVSVGPGNISADGALSETRDLHPGDRVLVKSVDVRQMGQGLAKAKTGVDYTVEGVKYTIYEQMHIIALIN